jgi:acyl-CoA dehydrogenase
MRVAMSVLGRAMGVHGARGLSDDTPLARWWAMARGLHIADGPEEVHLEIVARSELARAAEARARHVGAAG